MRSNNRNNTSNYLYLIALVMICGLLFAAVPAQADTISLGTAGDYNVFVFNQFTSSNSDTQGRIAAGGNVSLMNYGVGSGLSSPYDGNSLVVGGDLFYRNGQIQAGAVEVGGSADVNNSVGIGSGSLDDNVSKLSVSFDETKKELGQLSQDLSQMTATGTAELQYSTLRLTGDATSNVQVFNFNASALAGASGIALSTSIPSDAYIIFNILGKNASMTNQGQQALSSLSDRVIFNFINAELLTLSGISVQGTILAPNAHVDGNNGNLEGTLIADSFSGSLEFHDNKFTDLGGGGGGSGETPEPATMLLLSPALGGIYWWNRRKKRARA